MALTAAEGWTFEGPEFERLLDLGGGHVALRDGRIVGVLTTVLHGPLAWIGNVAVAPTERGRGLGEALLRGSLADLDGRGVETVGLYSVPRAVTLYERLGFRREGPDAWMWGVDDAARVPTAPRDPRVRLLAPGDVARAARLDAPRFGAHRERFLARLARDYPATAFVAEDQGALLGYALAKPSPTGTEIGPAALLGDDASVAAPLLDAVVEALKDLGVADLGVAVRAESPAAHSWLQERGFTRRFPTTPMFRGAPGHRGAPAAILAIGGLEKG